MPDENDDLMKRVAEITGSPFTPKATAPTTARGTYDRSGIADVLRQAGWDEKDIPEMSAIGMAESSGKVDAYNPGVGAGGRPTKEKSVGLFQINTLAHPEYDARRLATDPVYNAQAAYDIHYRKGQGRRAWEPTPMAGTRNI